jgi:hypothetical protein
VHPPLRSIFLILMSNPPSSTLPSRYGMLAGLFFASDICLGPIVLART